MSDNIKVLTPPRPRWIASFGPLNESGRNAFLEQYNAPHWLGRVLLRWLFDIHFIRYGTFLEMFPPPIPPQNAPPFQPPSDKPSKPSPPYRKRH